MGQRKARPTLREEAYYGILGDVVYTIAPETEADPAAMYLTLVAAIGNILGPEAYWKIGESKHPARIFALIVGDTNDGRKGTSYSAQEAFLKFVDSEWVEHCHRSGFQSGEGFLAQFADKEGAENPLSDKRCFSREEEFDRIFSVASRKGDTLSAAIRKAWDGSPQEIRRSKDTIVVKDLHLTLLGHITPESLRNRLSLEDCENGFANRFLYGLSERSKDLPDGGDTDSIKPRLQALAAEVAEALSLMKFTTFDFSDQARKLWHEFYKLKARPKGILKNLTTRREPYVKRIMVLLAAMDRTQVVNVWHLRAAIALWDYSFACADYIFGDLAGDLTSDKILAELQAIAPNGLCRAEIIVNVFSRNILANTLTDRIELLKEAGAIREATDPVAVKDGKKAAGRPAVRYFFVPPKEDEAGGNLSILSFNSFLSLPAVKSGTGWHERPAPPRPRAAAGSYVDEALRTKETKECNVRTRGGETTASSFVPLKNERNERNERNESSASVPTVRAFVEGRPKGEHCDCPDNADRARAPGHLPSCPNPCCYCLKCRRPRGGLVAAPLGAPEHNGQAPD